MKFTLKQAERALEYEVWTKAPNGNFWLAKRNGATKTWKTKPGEYRIPIRFGFRGNTFATQDSEWNFPGDGPNADFQVNTRAGKSDILAA